MKYRIIELTAGFLPMVESDQSPDNNLWFSLEGGPHKTIEEAKKAISDYSERNDPSKIKIVWQGEVPADKK